MIRAYADHSANERTFLAWVLTAIAIVGFGLAAARLGGRTGGAWSELALLGAGGAVVVAWLRMRRLRARIAGEERLDDDSPAADALLVALVVTLLALLGALAVHVGRA